MIASACDTVMRIYFSRDVGVYFLAVVLGILVSRAYVMMSCVRVRSSCSMTNLMVLDRLVTFALSSEAFFVVP
jgi:hypothetical protein